MAAGGIGRAPCRRSASPVVVWRSRIAASSARSRSSKCGFSTTRKPGGLEDDHRSGTRGEDDHLTREVLVAHIPHNLDPGPTGQSEVDHGKVRCEPLDEADGVVGAVGFGDDLATPRFDQRRDDRPDGDVVVAHHRPHIACCLAARHLDHPDPLELCTPCTRDAFNNTIANTCARLRSHQPRARMRPPPSPVARPSDQISSAPARGSAPPADGWNRGRGRDGPRCTNGTTGATAASGCTVTHRSGPSPRLIRRAPSPGRVGLRGAGARLFAHACRSAAHPQPQSWRGARATR